MNKYIIIAIVLVFLIGGGIGYRTFFAPEGSRVIETGVVREITIIVNENTWSFNPEFIEADQGDRLILTVINEDEYDHGFAIDAFGISQRMPALGTIKINFVVTKAGDFPYYCSVSCGSGIVDGEKRGHFDQIGKLHVRSVISETIDFAPQDTEAIKRDARRAATIQEANRRLEEIGRDSSGFQVIYDDDNALWKESGTTLPELTERAYQAVRYLSTKGELDVWIFIDTETGEVITHHIGN